MNVQIKYFGTEKMGMVDLKTRYGNGIVRLKDSQIKKIRDMERECGGTLISDDVTEPIHLNYNGVYLRITHWGDMKIVCPEKQKEWDNADIHNS